MQGRMRPPDKNYKPTTMDTMYELMNNLIFHQHGRDSLVELVKICRTWTGYMLLNELFPRHCRDEIKKSQLIRSKSKLSIQPYIDPVHQTEKEVDPNAEKEEKLREKITSVAEESMKTSEQRKEES
ncbi:hypothetical protein DUI87_07477 [Hirundo rustica rustica]|uniref:Uncharacterized protein n=1 Tax=Hirundo rustica rustica TaxID=333673 RepID=A0A3M0KPZ1_HIRRU|nr:hypothetical protein DUI87_07477 [Hirundo rustica rustica]